MAVAMTVERACEILGAVRWLRIRDAAVTASTWTPKRCKVHIRRRNGETFASMLIRAAEMVEAGFMPTNRPNDFFARCPCGSRDDLRKMRGWDEWLCGECRRALAPKATAKS